MRDADTAEEETVGHGEEEGGEGGRVAEEEPGAGGVHGTDPEGVGGARYQLGDRDLRHYSDVRDALHDAGYEAPDQVAGDGFAIAVSQLRPAPRSR